ncbi:MAG: damage-inducible protein DinB [Mucilaginibacter sp.]|nr:damage-inducible protein DinB [Mucilaginibacter sp.]
MINRPQPDEFVPFQANYIKLVGNEPILEILEQLKEDTYKFLTGIPADKADHTYGSDKWTVKEVLGHMIDAERTFAYRFFFAFRARKLYCLVLTRMFICSKQPSKIVCWPIWRMNSGQCVRPICTYTDR